VNPPGSQPHTAREALLAELLGDVQLLLERVASLQDDMARAEAGAKHTVAALVEANEQYRRQVDDLMARLRVEFSGLLTTVTTHAVGLQAKAMQDAAVLAIRQAVNADMAARHRRDGLTIAAWSAGVASAVTLLLCGVAKALGWL
jgi:hypothetical protein